MVKRHFSPKRVMRFVTLFLTLFGACHSAAQSSENWYQIEYILFEHLYSDRRVLEHEVVTPPSRSNEEYRYLSSLVPKLSPEQLEPLIDQDGKATSSGQSGEAITLSLAEAFTRLKRSRDVRVLSSGNWKEPISQNETKLPIRITTNPTGIIGKLSHPLPEHFVDEQPEENQLLPISLTYQFDPTMRTHYEIEGSLQIKLSRYLHAEIDVHMIQHDFLPCYDLLACLTESDEERWPLLTMISPLANEPFDNALRSLNDKGIRAIPTKIIHLKQSRRIKDGEIQYIDHPALGLIVTINKTDAPFEFGIANEQ